MLNRDRSSHVSKTRNERSAYQRYIHRLESQPTIEEPIEIDPSYEAGQELAESTSRSKRTIPLSLRIRDHLEKNWIGWSFGLLMVIAIFFLYDARVNIAIFNHDLSNQQQKLDRISTSLDNITYTDHAQDLIIQELRIRLEYLVNTITVSPTENAPSESP